ncbi:hypothetical protein EDC40_11724 [Aminobacter aminovorans]|uniref:Uncharacterized protein n=1 Tax=Aminobacter aminovorans TaxID=83263 RepID=A0A381IJG9_AMIAI|nr:hypothetical protein [Aminobacter aminovorans]TCS20490.1 hypothetical protein EDC40_11724 [Aminobacter aminovorans]SUY28263.1 Uncharacterised protein [Aminobacter aminovorans]
MKTPQRTFVVEFKSRRQSKSHANSIWGDTDLKALAKEVEDQQADLSYPGHARHTAGTGAVTSPVKVDTHSSDEPAVAADLAQIAGGATVNSPTDGLPKLNAAQSEVASVGAAQEDVHSSRPRKISKRTPQRRAQRGQPAGNSVHQTEQVKIAAEPFKLDDITALDAENKRLRHLLVEHLRDQNSRLKQMLERFDLS